MEEDTDNLALVLRPSGTLEKAQSGAKRILSGMVADALETVKQNPPTKRTVHVLMAGAPEFGEYFPDVVGLADDGLKADFDLHFHSCQRMEELARALKQRRFDLALVQLHVSPPAEHKFTDKREVMLRVETLIAKNHYIIRAGLEVACFLHTVHGIPVVMLSDTGQGEVEKLLADQVGARALFPLFGMEDVQAFCVFLRGILLQIHCTPRISNPLRVVMVDDDPDLLGVYVKFFQEWFSQVDFVSFDKPLKALEELDRHDPDLLITGVRMPGIDGYQLIELLFARKIQYPILVLTFYGPAKVWVEDYAKRGFNVQYHPKPGNEHEAEQLRRSIGELLQIRSGSTGKQTKLAQPPKPSAATMNTVHREV